MDYHVLWPYDQVTNYLENMILFLKNYCGAPGGPAFAIFATIARFLNFEEGIFFGTTQPPLYVSKAQPF